METLCKGPQWSRFAVLSSIISLFAHETAKFFSTEGSCPEEDSQLRYFLPGSQGCSGSRKLTPTLTGYFYPTLWNIWGLHSIGIINMTEEESWLLFANSKLCTTVFCLDSVVLSESLVRILSTSIWEDTFYLPWAFMYWILIFHKQCFFQRFHSHEQGQKRQGHRFKIHNLIFVLSYMSVFFKLHIIYVFPEKYQEGILHSFILKVMNYFLLWGERH